MKIVAVIDAALRYREPAVSTRSGKWHPTGSRRRKAMARQFRREEPAMEAMTSKLWERSDTFLEAGP